MSKTLPLPGDCPVVHVVDDDSSVQRLLNRLCRRLGVDCAFHTTAEQFLDLYDPARPGCLVLDLYLPRMSGFELHEEAERRNWRIPVVFISGRAEVAAAVRAFRRGSVDFLEKPLVQDELESALRRALDADRDQRIERDRLSQLRDRLVRLTPRERQVMERVVDGMSNRLIAENLGVSPKTVEVHRANVMQKMQADSLADLVKMVVSAVEADATAPR